MKKLLVALALAAFASTASATIAGRPHDMTQYGGTKGTCQYCHAPHLWIGSNVAAGSAAPLWNRNVVDTAFTAYTTAANPAAAPGARSLTCLSCHDGRTNVGVVNNGTDETLTVPAAVGNWVVDTNLQDDHPVGVTLPATGYQNPTTNILINSRVECASCHEPHNNNSFFLRASGGTICSDCHTK